MNLLDRLHALGVPTTVSHDTVAEVTRWLEKSGPEWTVKRLKNLKQELINRLSENDYRAPWVSRNIDGYPKGPFSWYFRMALSGNERKASLAINSLMLYSSFVSDSITKDQENKFFSSMESNDETGLRARPRIIPKLGDSVDGKFYSYVPFIAATALSSSKFQAGSDGRSYPETDLGRQFEFCIESDACRYLVLKHSPIFRKVLPYQYFVDIEPKLRSSRSDNQELILSSIGKISFIQEPGFKLRAVANPSRVIQSGLEPLKSFVKELLLVQETDCTFDQGKGISRIQGWIREGRTCHSIDLSDATNLFPRNYQIHLIREMIAQLSSSLSRSSLNECLELFRSCCEFPWFSKRKDGSVGLHQFKRGQPLGLGPSFFIFGYTHNILLEGLCLKHNLPKDFVVLGDDVCISNDKLASLYRASLTNLGCKIAESKSIVSCKYAEFAGVVITGRSLIHQYKWRDIDDSNFVDVCRQLGHRSVHLLTYSQRAVIEAIAEIPSELGGMGWNPLGKSLDERLSTPIAQMFVETRGVTPVLFESVKSRNNRFWNDPIVRGYYPSGELPEVSRTPTRRTEADQASFARMMPYNRYWTEHLSMLDKRESLGIPVPDFIVSDKEHIPAYVCTVPLLGDIRKKRFLCVKSILQNKIRNVRIPIRDF